MIVVLGIAAAGCASDLTPPDAGPAPEPNVADVEYADVCPVNLDEFVRPVYSLSDWASLSDEVVAFTVVVENMGEPRPYSSFGGERYMDRTLTLDVDGHLYAFPGAPQMPDRLEVEAAGTGIGEHGGVYEGDGGEGPRLEVGRHYLGSFQQRGGSHPWQLQTSSSVFEVKSDVLQPTPCDRVCRDGRDPPQSTCAWRNRMVGRSVEEIRMRLQTAPLNPFLTTEEHGTAGVQRSEVVATREQAALDAASAS